jgi:two-component system, OmpR family, response regulator
MIRMDPNIKSMNTENKIKLFLVDDDAVYLRLLEIEFLRHGDFVIETFSSGELCLEKLSHGPDVIVLDYHLDSHGSHGINGLETLDKIKTFNSDIHVLMLSSQDKIEVAVNCMRHRAFDYIVKSETAFMRLQHNISTIFSYKRMAKELNWYMNRT